MTLRRLVKYFYILVPISLLAYAGFDPAATDISNASVITKRYYRYLMFGVNLISISGIWYAINVFGLSRLSDTAVYKWLIGLTVWLYLVSLFSVQYFGWATARQELIQLTFAVLWLSIIIIMQPLIRVQRDLHSTVKVLRVFGIVCGASVYAGLIANQFGINFGEIDQESRDSFIRYFGPIGDQVGFILILFAIIALCYQRWLEFAFYVGAIVLTGTRGAMIALVIGATWNFFAYRRNSGGLFDLFRRVLTVSLVMGTIVIVTVSTLGTATRERLLTRTSFFEGISSRAEVFSLAVEIFRSYPITGVGYGGFRYTQVKVGEAANAGTKSDENRGIYFVQNQILQFATDGGIICFILYAGFAISVIRLSRHVIFHALPADKRALAGFESFLVASFIGNQSAVWFVSEAASGYMIMMAAGVILAYDRMIKGTIEGFASRAK